MDTFVTFVPKELIIISSSIFNYFSISVPYLISFFFSENIFHSFTLYFQGGLRSLFVVRHVKNMVTDFFKRRPNNVRGQVIILTIVYTLLQIIDQGLNNLEYLYTRQKLKWAMADYTSYFSTDTMLSFLGGIAGVICLQTYLRVSDVVLIAVSVASSAAGYLVFALAEQSWHMYLGKL